MIILGRAGKNEYGAGTVFSGFQAHVYYKGVKNRPYISGD